MEEEEIGFQIAGGEKHHASVGLHAFHWRFVVLCLLVVLAAILPLSGTVQATDAVPMLGDGRAQFVLSPSWRHNIQQWSDQIAAVSRKYGLDPDLIAAVMQAESHGNPLVESSAGAVGLMGVMPAGPGMEFRPSPEELQDPVLNLDWGTAILIDILYQAGGDLFTALTAYNGGWQYAGKRVPQQYAAEVLDYYGRAVAARSGVNPEIATSWTIGIALERGLVSTDPLLMNQQPLSGLRTYGEHVLLSSLGDDGLALYVKAYAVPLALVRAPVEELPLYDSSDTLPPQLMARLGEGDKTGLVETNYRVLLACLPSLSRLRGRISTRWFAPSTCPSWHR